MSRAEVCHCGHDQATHFKHEGKHLTCLGVSCDCEAYLHRDEPKPVSPKPAPPEYVDDGWPDPVTHRTGCQCIVCAWRYGP